MSRIGTTLLVLALTVPASAQQSTFHDAHGRVTGSAHTDTNGVTTFHDRAGRITGTARTDSNGVTTFHDAAIAAVCSLTRRSQQVTRLFCGCVTSGT